MNNEGGEIKVGFGQRPPWIGVLDQRHNDIWWTGLATQDACAGSGGFKLHAYRTDSRSVTEPQVGGLLTDDAV